MRSEQLARLATRLRAIAMTRGGQPVRMMRHEDFQQNIFENPGEDFPKLMYADWLEEHNLPATAELIRLHVGKGDPQAIDNEDGIYRQIGYHGTVYGGRGWDEHPDVITSLDSTHDHGPYFNIHLRGYAEVPRGKKYYSIVSHATRNADLARRVMEENLARPHGHGSLDDIADHGVLISQYAQRQQPRTPERLARACGRAIRMARQLYDPNEMMGFHRAIAQEPNENSHKLIYADWLEEHGLPATAELIRRSANGNDAERDWHRQVLSAFYNSDEHEPWMSVRSHVYTGKDTRPVVYLELHGRTREPERDNNGNITRDASADYTILAHHRTHDLNLAQRVFEEHNADEQNGRPYMESDVSEPTTERPIFNKLLSRYRRDNPDALARTGVVAHLERTARFAKIDEARGFQFAGDESDQPLRAKPILRSGLVELPWGGSLMKKAADAPEFTHAPMQSASEASRTLAGGIPVRPASRVQRGPFTGTVDERRAGDGPVYALTTPRGTLAGTEAAALAEGQAMRKALRAIGAPVNHPIWAAPVIQNHTEAAANFLRTQPTHPASVRYRAAVADPRRLDLDELDAASAGLVHASRLANPWLSIYDELARKDERRTIAKPRQEPAIVTEDREPATKEADFQPSIRPAEDLPPIKPAKLPGEMSRKPGVRGRIGLMEEMHAAGASDEAIADALQNKFWLLPGNAKRAVREFRKRLAARKLRRMFEPLRMRRG